MSEFPKIKLPRGSLTFTGEYLLEKHGGDMWQELKKFLNQFDIKFPIVDEKIKQIEKEHNITYVE